MNTEQLSAIKPPGSEVVLFTSITSTLVVANCATFSALVLIEPHFTGWDVVFPAENTHT